MTGFGFSPKSSCPQLPDSQTRQRTLATTPVTVRCPFVTRLRLLVVLIVSLTTTALLLVYCLRPCELPVQRHSACCHRNIQAGRYAGATFAPENDTNVNHNSPEIFVSGEKPVGRRHNIVLQGNSLERAAAGGSSADDEISGGNSISQENDAAALLAADYSRGRMKRRLPQCLIIGVRKGGTRALLEFLNLHPAILAGKQEMHFFDDDGNYALGLEWYRKRMRYSLPDQITVEKTPAYFVDERVPARVHRMNRTIKLLLTVRDPIDRAISDYLQIHSSRLHRGKYHPRFEDLAINSATGEVNKSYKAIRRSIYHRHFERWLRYFPLELFHFVSGENLVRDPVGELRKVERFLAIENRLNEGRFLYNRTRGFYCMVSPNGGERCLAPSKGRVHPHIDPRVLEKLRQFFKPHNARFYQMVGVDFGWQ